MTISHDTSQSPVSQFDDQRLNEILARLVQARKAAGLTQSNTARLMGLGGVASTVSDWETGRNGLSLSHFINLCKLYDASEEWVLTGVNPYFDPSELMQAMDKASDSLKEDLEDLMETFAMLRQNPGGVK